MKRSNRLQRIFAFGVVALVAAASAARATPGNPVTVGSGNATLVVTCTNGSGSASLSMVNGTSDTVTFSTTDVSLTCPGYAFSVSPTTVAGNGSTLLQVEVTAGVDIPSTCAVTVSATPVTGGASQTSIVTVDASSCQLSSPMLAVSPSTPINIGNAPLNMQTPANFELINNSPVHASFDGTLTTPTGFSPTNSNITLDFTGDEVSVSQSFAIMFTATTRGSFESSFDVYDQTNSQAPVQSINVVGYGFGIELPDDGWQSVVNGASPSTPNSFSISSGIALREISLVPVADDSGFTVAMTPDFLGSFCMSPSTATDCFVNPDIPIPFTVPLSVPVTCVATTVDTHHANIIVSDNGFPSVTTTALLECDGLQASPDNTLTLTVSPPQFTSPTTICMGDLWGPGINGGGSSGSGSDNGISLTWTNTGSFPLTLQPVGLTQDQQLFSFATNSNSSTSIAAAQSFSNMLFFDSAAASNNPPQTYQASVTWTTTNQLSGSQDFMVTTVPDVTINSGNSIGFPQTSLGSTTTQSISIAMCGDREGELSANLNQPDGQTAFQLVSAQTQDISGTDSTVEVQFTPTAAGEFHASLVVNIKDIGTNDGMSTTATGIPTSLTITLDANGSGAGLQSYYESGCRVSDSSSGTGALVLSLGTIVAIGSRRRKVVSRVS